MTYVPLSELIRLFDRDNERRVTADQLANATRTYYRRLLSMAEAKLGPSRNPAELRAGDLLRAGLTSWHQVQALQRLLAWAVGLDLLPGHHLARMPKVSRPGRTRTLTSQEWSCLLTGIHPALRLLLQFQRYTLCRPGEARGTRWADYDASRALIVLTDHKTRRTNTLRRPRVLVLSSPAKRLVEGLQPPSSRQPEAHLFLNSRGAPWTSSALRIAVRRACRRLGLDETHGEKIVAYTIRHTAATAATVAGVRDRHLADLMGHSTTRTTARYQHLDVEHLRKAAELLGAA